MKKIGLNNIQRHQQFSLATALVFIVIAIIGGWLVYRGTHAASASMTLSPGSGPVGLGSNVVVSIDISTYKDTDLTDGDSSDYVNAVEADLSYPADKLQFVSIDTSSSKFELQALNNGGSGKVQIARATLNHVAGDNNVAKVTFKAIGLGAANVTIDNSSAIVRDRDNVNILDVTNPASYSISDTTPPNAPTGLTSPSRTPTTIGLAWTAATDDVGVTKYQVLRNGVNVGTTTTTSFTNTGLTPNTSYSYTILAQDAAGNVSPPSSALAVSTMPDTTPPSVPTGLQQSSKSMTSIGLSWTASTDNVDVVGYKIFRNGTQIATSVSPAYTNTGLTPGTTYSYTVSAYDAAGNNSAQTAAASFDTSPDTVAPGTPTGLQATVSANKVSLSWTASTDNVAVSGYKIYRNGTQVGTSATTSYADNNLTAGTYSYKVAAFDAVGNTSAQSTAASATVVNLVGDLNHDGKVNLLDLSAMIGQYNQSGSGLTGDLNGDGVVNILDVSKLISNWHP